VLANSYVKDRHVTAVGKTEWAAIKWNEQSIAAKKTMANSAAFLFTAFEETESWPSRVQELRQSNVNHRLLDCSDAHYFSSSAESNRIGNCKTWVNSTPSLAGLKYALKEFDRRVYVGLEPPPLSRIRRNPSRFIEEVTVSSDLDPVDRTFDYSLPLNPGFVAVIGNKGQGKSAFLDCIAAAGNSARSAEYAFLNSRRFLSPINRTHADAHFAELRWATHQSRRVELSRLHDASAPTEVEYLPQAFVERICQTSPGDPEGDDFETELRAILFTHIPEQERAGESDFESLLRQKTRASRDAIAGLRSTLEEVAAEYAAISRFRASLDLKQIDGRIAEQSRELQAAERSLLDEEASLGALDSRSGTDAELEALLERAERVGLRRAEVAAELAANAQRRASLSQAIAGVDAILQRAGVLADEVRDLNDEASTLLYDRGQLLAFSIDIEGHRAWSSRIEAEFAQLDEARAVLQVDAGLASHEQQEVDGRLATLDGARERARQRVLDARARVDRIEGSESDPDSLAALRVTRARLQEAPGRMDGLRTKLLETSEKIFEQFAAQRLTVEALYRPASEFTGTSEVLAAADLQFVSELRVSADWRGIPEALDGRKNGDLPEELEVLPHSLPSLTWIEIEPRLSRTIRRLELEGSVSEGAFRDPATALKSSIDLTRFLVDLLGLTWLDVRFALTGYGRPLSSLSPGQRGLMLALFYLVVDQRDSPLLLDQPEENLDNATIAASLVPAIHDAAGRRQTIVVTHNANLAVVGDADQVVHCQFDDSRFSVSGGSIAELDVAQLSIDVLEGTLKAFTNRRDKYASFPELE
jgi:ABC-type lipoprotein export system ATPase subunit